MTRNFHTTFPIHCLNFKEIQTILFFGEIFSQGVNLEFFTIFSKK